MPSVRTKKSSAFDILIVFGQGPIKPILLETELTSEQKKEWIAYKNDPHHTEEPEFWLMSQEKLLHQLDAIHTRTDISPEEKIRQAEMKRQEWQYTGWFALKQWGRRNALAAGSALYKGTTKQVLLTGGRTIPRWAKTVLPKRRVENWPSEAELMKDIIVRYYGSLYFKKYGKDIAKAIRIEDQATNTIENFAYSINMEPSLILKTLKVGFLSTGYHLKRLTILADLFSLETSQKSFCSAQDLLDEDDATVAILRDKTNPLHQTLHSLERRWITGLTDPSHIGYWVGYIGLVKEPTVIQRAFRRLSEKPWKQAAQELFHKIGLNFNELVQTDMVSLYQKDPKRYAQIQSTLQRCIHEHRTLPSSNL